MSLYWGKTSCRTFRLANLMHSYSSSELIAWHWKERIQNDTSRPFIFSLLSSHLLSSDKRVHPGKIFCPSQAHKETDVSFNFYYIITGLCFLPPTDRRLHLFACLCRHLLYFLLLRSNKDLSFTHSPVHFIEHESDLMTETWPEILHVNQ